LGCAPLIKSSKDELSDDSFFNSMNGLFYAQTRDIGALSTLS